MKEDTLFRLQMNTDELIPLKSHRLPNPVGLRSMYNYHNVRQMQRRDTNRHTLLTCGIILVNRMFAQHVYH